MGECGSRLVFRDRELAVGGRGRETSHAFRSGAHAQRGADGEPMCVVAIADDEGARRGCGGLMITSGALEVHHTLLELDSDCWPVETRERCDTSAPFA
jgi:hypothetical protein